MIFAGERSHPNTFCRQSNLRKVDRLTKVQWERVRAPSRSVGKEELAPALADYPHLSAAGPKVRSSSPILVAF